MLSRSLITSVMPAKVNTARALAKLESAILGDAYAVYDHSNYDDISLAKTSYNTVISKNLEAIRARSLVP